MSGSLPHERLKTHAAKTAPIAQLFTQEKHRLNNFTISAGGDSLRADFSKQAIDEAGRQALLEFAHQCQIETWRARLFAGERINQSENRAVLHPVLRGTGGTEAIQMQVKALNQRLEKFITHIRRMRPYQGIVHIGIGGSSLGPQLVADAFAAHQSAELTLRFCDNVDGAAINDALAGLDPAKTLVVIASKSFCTPETHINGLAARQWLTESLGAKQAARQCVAITAHRAGAEAFGIAPEQIFDFWDWVGGRYSVWSAVSLAVQIAYGTECFSEFLQGAADMDRHFLNQPLADNMPVMMALVGFWNCTILGYGSLAIIPYARRLQHLPAFLQQLEMESNGKSVRRDGQRLTSSCPVIWGGQGTNSQHAFFQWLHQSPSIAPVDFIAILEDSDNRLEHHRALLANCFAQSQALMLGSGTSPPGCDKPIAGQKHFCGNRPSSTITLKTLSPYTVGGLLALYEHKVFVQSILWGVNGFDQWGVELGKKLAENLLADMQNPPDNSPHDASTQALMSLVARHVR